MRPNFLNSSPLTQQIDGVANAKPRSTRRAVVALIAFCFFAVVAGPALSRAQTLPNMEPTANIEGCSHWASAQARKSGGRGTEASPFSIARFFEVAKPGSTLCLLDGIYRGAHQMIRPPAGLSGKPGAPITIRAANDGEVLIDGGSRASKTTDHRPVALRLNNHWILEGFNAGYSNSNVLSIMGEQFKGDAHPSRVPIRDVTIRRVVAWDADPCFPDRKDCSSNRMVVSIAAADDVLLEDVAAFGTGRKIFQVYQSRRIVIRRSWGRWEGNGRRHVQTFSCAYRSYDVICENIFGTWSGESQPANVPVKQLKTIIGMDWHTDKDNSWSGKSDAWDVGLRLLGSLAYVEQSALHPPQNGVTFGRVKNAVLTDVVSYLDLIPKTGNTFSLQDCEFRVPNESPGCTWKSNLERQNSRLHLERLTAIGGDGKSRIHSVWNSISGTKQVFEFQMPSQGPSASQQASMPNVFTGEGARLCHRYVDGQLTSEPLWPWPMNERIRKATDYARSAPVDLTATVARLFGPIPEICGGAQSQPEKQER